VTDSDISGPEHRLDGLARTTGIKHS